MNDALLLLARKVREVILFKEHTLTIGDYRFIKNGEDLVIASDKTGGVIASARVIEIQTVTRVYYKNTIIDLPLGLEFPKNSTTTNSNINLLLREMLGPVLCDDLVKSTLLKYSNELLYHKSLDLLTMLTDTTVPNESKLTIGDVEYHGTIGISCDLNYKTIHVLALGKAIGLISVERFANQFHVKWHGMSEPVHECYLPSIRSAGETNVDVLEINKLIAFFTELSKGKAKVTKENKLSISINVSFDPTLSQEEVTNSLLQGLGSCISDIDIDFNIGKHVSFEVRNKIRQGISEVIVNALKSDERKVVQAIAIDVPPKPEEPLQPRVVSSVTDILMHEYNFFELENVQKFLQEHVDVCEFIKDSNKTYSYAFLKALAEFTNTTVQYWINIHNNHLKSIGRSEVNYPEVSNICLNTIRNHKFSEIVNRRFNSSGQTFYSLSLIMGLTESHTRQLLSGGADWEDLLNKFDSLYKAFGSSPEYWAEVYKNCGNQLQE